MRRVALVIAFLVAFVGPAFAQKARIEAVNVKWVELFNRGDFEGIANMYTAECDRISAGRHRLCVHQVFFKAHS